MIPIPNRPNQMCLSKNRPREGSRAAPQVPGKNGAVANSHHIFCHRIYTYNNMVFFSFVHIYLQNQSCHSDNILFASSYEAGETNASHQHSLESPTYSWWTRSSNSISQAILTVDVHTFSIFQPFCANCSQSRRLLLCQLLF